MEEKDFKCTGNCLNCLPAQRAYCASQHAYSNMKVLDAMMQEVLNIKNEVASFSGKIETISGKLEAIQNNEASIFNPNEDNSEKPNLPIAQEGDGAEE